MRVIVLQICMLDSQKSPLPHVTIMQKNLVCHLDSRWSPQRSYSSFIMHGHHAEDMILSPLCWEETLDKSLRFLEVRWLLFFRRKVDTSKFEAPLGRFPCLSEMALLFFPKAILVASVSVRTHMASGRLYAEPDTRLYLKCDMYRHDAQLSGSFLV